MQVNIPSFTSSFDGQVIIIGFGSIGKGLLPLLRRHMPNLSGITIFDPSSRNASIAYAYGANFIEISITEENYEEQINKVAKDKTFIVNVANEVSSFDLVQLCSEREWLYIDTVVEPWPGTYFNSNLSLEEQTNYALRKKLLSLRNILPTHSTAISCCGANPGMVSWLTKTALLNMAKQYDIDTKRPESREEWSKLMHDLQIRGIHIAEYDSQVPKFPKKPNQFLNTWSPMGFVAEALQPAELGWGTFEEDFPINGNRFEDKDAPAIYLNDPGGKVEVQTWTPEHGKHPGFLVTHNEAISIADYFSLFNGEGELVYRPTCHYAYRPSDVAIESLRELFDDRQTKMQDEWKVLEAEDIATGNDELGVLLYRTDNSAYWYGSTLSIEKTKILVPHPNATGLQVTSAVLSGMMYAINHPAEGLIEAEEMDHVECLYVQSPYLGTIAGHNTSL